MPMRQQRGTSSRTLVGAGFGLVFLRTSNPAPSPFRGVVRTPIRAHTTGTNAIGQVLVDRMADVLGTESGAASTIVFADSRDDAANTAAGLELNHFRDLVRQLIRREARTDDPEKLLRLIRSAAAGTQAPTAEDAVVLDQFKRAYPDEWTAYRLAARAAADAAEERLIQPPQKCSPSHVSRCLAMDSLKAIDKRSLVNLGVNPAGPSRSRQLWDGEPWWRIYEPVAGQWQPLDREMCQRAAAQRRFDLARWVSLSVFDRAGRDLESIAVGWIESPDIDLGVFPLQATMARQISASSIRILGLAEYVAGSDRQTDSPPAALKRYLGATADRHGCSSKDLLEALEHSFRSAGLFPIGPRWELQTHKAGVGLAIRTDPENHQVWRCLRCSQVHMHQSGGICINRSAHVGGLRGGGPRQAAHRARQPHLPHQSRDRAPRDADSCPLQLLSHLPKPVPLAIRIPDPPNLGA